VNNLWNQIMEAVIGCALTVLIGAIVKTIKTIFERVFAHRKKKCANNDLINYFHSTVTPDQGGLSYISYSKQKIILAEKHHMGVHDFLSYKELEQRLLNDAEEAPFINSDNRQKIKERILNLTHDNRGSVSVEVAGCLLLVSFAVFGLCKAIMQIQTNTFSITYSKIAGFLLVASLSICYYWRKRKS